MKNKKNFPNKHLLLLLAFLLGALFSLLVENKIYDITPPILKKNSSKKVALTFDDGPGEETQKILDILKKENVAATFFVIGKFAEQNPDMVKKEFEEGYEVENHSYDHSKFLASTSTQELLTDVNKNSDIVEKITGVRPKFFRPPYGNVSSNMIKTLNSQGYKTILWDVDPRDWEIQNNPDKVEANILKNVFNNSVILLHDGKSVYSGSESKKITDENTQGILDDLIIKLKAQGFEFVTVSQIYK